MTLITTNLPGNQVASMVQLMRQELVANYPISEVESLIHYTFREVCQMNRMDVVIRAEEHLTPEVVKRFQEITSRLKDHEPIQYIFGHAEFCGLDILLSEDVLIPRPETEELVYWIKSFYESEPPKSVLDIGTGSGCIALALKKLFPQAAVSATDVSAEVVRMARENAVRNQLDVSITQSNILNGSSELGQFDLIVSNPPYVTREQMGDMLPNVLNYEPHLALFVHDNDALKFYKAIAKFCQSHLTKNGALFLEINEDLASDTLSLLETFNFTQTSVKKDLNGKFRMVKAMW